MKQLIETRFFRLLMQSGDPPDDELQTAFDEFSNIVIVICDAENCKNIYRILNYTKTKLQAMFEEISPPLKTSSLLIKIALSLIDNEMELFRLRLNFPELFASQNDRTKSPLYLAPSVKLADIMEYITPLDLSDSVIFADGQKASFAKLTEEIEKLFNISFGNCYEKKEDILIRKRHRTRFLDKLKVILEEHNKNNFTHSR